MVALAARDDAETFRIAAFEPVLTRELDRGFGGFRSAGGEINAAAVAKIGRSQREQALGEFFGGCGMKLRRVGEGDLRRLFGHRAPDFGDAVADADDGGLAGSVEKPAAVGGENPGAFAANRDRQVFAKISGKQS